MSPKEPTEKATALVNEAAEVRATKHYGVQCFAADVWYRGHHVFGHGVTRPAARRDLALRLSDFAGLRENELVTYQHPAGCEPETVWQRQRVAALNRIAAELRGMLADAPADDPDASSLLRDCATLEEVASMLARPITLSAIPTAATGRKQP